MTEEVKNKLRGIILENEGDRDDILSDTLRYLKGLEVNIYMTYDPSDGEVFAAFTDKKRCRKEAIECGTDMQSCMLYFGNDE